MRGIRGFFGGILILSALYAVLQPGAPERVGGLLGDVSRLLTSGIKRLSDPKLAGVKDYSKGK